MSKHLAWISCLSLADIMKLSKRTSVLTRPPPAPWDLEGFRSSYPARCPGAREAQDSSQDPGFHAEFTDVEGQLQLLPYGWSCERLT